MKKIAMPLALICIIASIVMFIVGSKSGHLSELKDFFWMPLPLALILFFIGSSKKNPNPGK